MFEEKKIKEIEFSSNTFFEKNEIERKRYLEKLQKSGYTESYLKIKLSFMDQDEQDKFLLKVFGSDAETAKSFLL